MSYLKKLFYFFSGSSILGRCRRSSAKKLISIHENHFTIAAIRMKMTVSANAADFVRRLTPGVNAHSF